MATLRQTVFSPRLQALIAVALATACRTAPDAVPQLPRTVLWAWERPEDLRFVNPHSTAVAFLTRTVVLSHSTLASRPRLQPLRFAKDTLLIPVIRLESDGSALPPVSLVDRAIREVLATVPNASAFQIDFDARRSERAWYTALLTGLPKLPPLTITALASWCEDDGWIRSLPIAAAVPMLFRMGPNPQPPRNLNFPIALCRENLGLAADELPAQIPLKPRLWLFTTRPWTSDSVSAIVREARRRQ